MAASSNLTGFDQVDAMLSKLGADAERIAEAALYVGAGVAAGYYKTAIQEIKTEPFRHGSIENRRLASPEEKAALHDSTGIATFRAEGGAEVNTVVGVGVEYATIGGKKKARRKIANAINSGTSFMQKQPVFRKVAKQCRKAVEDAMMKKAEELINQITK